MARNKYPEETVLKIVEVATRLFIEQGYDNTSIQDIINHLGGLSKGAIYHHFRSKEEILDAVTDYLFKDSDTRLWEIAGDKSLTGIEKLCRMLEDTAGDASQQQLFSLSINMMNNPQILAMQMRSTVEETAHKLILPVIQEGILDGSMAGLEYPEEFAEVFMLLVNIWMNPMIYAVTPEQMERKCRFFQRMVEGFGITEPIISDKVIQKLQTLYGTYEKNKKKV